MDHKIRKLCAINQDPNSKNESYRPISRKTDIATYRDNACNQKESPRVQSIKINNNYMQKIKDLDHKIRKFI